MEHVFAIQFHTWLLAETWGVADGAQFFLILCASANLVGLFGDALRLEARKALAFAIDASAIMTARQDFVAWLLDHLLAFDVIADFMEGWTVLKIELLDLAVAEAALT